ncbi:unnamed protein product, partial [Trichogramma brassicae]
HSVAWRIKISDIRADENLKKSYELLIELPPVLGRLERIVYVVQETIQIAERAEQVAHGRLVFARPETRQHDLLLQTVGVQTALLHRTYGPGVVPDVAHHLGPAQRLGYGFLQHRDEMLLAMRIIRAVLAAQLILAGEADVLGEELEGQIDSAAAGASLYHRGRRRAGCGTIDLAFELFAEDVGLASEDQLRSQNSTNYPHREQHLVAVLEKSIAEPLSRAEVVRDVRHYSRTICPVKKCRLHANSLKEEIVLTRFRAREYQTAVRDLLGTFCNLNRLLDYDLYKIQLNIHSVAWRIKISDIRADENLKKSYELLIELPPVLGRLERIVYVVQETIQIAERAEQVAHGRLVFARPETRQHDLLLQTVGVQTALLHRTYGPGVVPDVAHHLGPAQRLGYGFLQHRDEMLLAMRIIRAVLAAQLILAGEADVLGEELEGQIDSAAAGASLYHRGRRRAGCGTIDLAFELFAEDVGLASEDQLRSQNSTNYPHREQHLVAVLEKSIAEPLSRAEVVRDVRHYSRTICPVKKCRLHANSLKEEIVLTRFRAREYQTAVRDLLGTFCNLNRLLDYDLYKIQLNIHSVAWRIKISDIRADENLKKSYELLIELPPVLGRLERIVYVVQETIQIAERAEQVAHGRLVFARPETRQHDLLLQTVGVQTALLHRTYGPGVVPDVAHHLGPAQRLGYGFLQHRDEMLLAMRIIRAVLAAQLILAGEADVLGEELEGQIDSAAAGASLYHRGRRRAGCGTIDLAFELFAEDVGLASEDQLRSQNSTNYPHREQHLVAVLEKSIAEPLSRAEVVRDVRHYSRTICPVKKCRLHANSLKEEIVLTRFRAREYQTAVRDLLGTFCNLNRLLDYDLYKIQLNIHSVAWRIKISDIRADENLKKSYELLIELPPVLGRLERIVYVVQETIQIAERAEQVAHGRLVFARPETRQHDLLLQTVGVQTALLHRTYGPGVVPDVAHHLGPAQRLGYGFLQHRDEMLLAMRIIRAVLAAQLILAGEADVLGEELEGQIDSAAAGASLYHRGRRRAGCGTIDLAFELFAEDVGLASEDQLRSQNSTNYPHREQHLVAVLEKSIAEPLSRAEVVRDVRHYSRTICPVKKCRLHANSLKEEIVLTRFRAREYQTAVRDLLGTFCNLNRLLDYDLYKIQLN